MPWPPSTKTERVPNPNVHDAACPTRSILDDVMARWGSLVVTLLLEQTYRFSELVYMIGGVSEKMLSQTLRKLAADGFVCRKVHNTKPPKVEYSLSPLGRELAEHVHRLVEFVEVNQHRILDNRQEAHKRAVKQRSSKDGKLSPTSEHYRGNISKR